MTYSIIATNDISKSTRVLATYAKLETAEKNLKKQLQKTNWFNETYSIKIA